MINLFFQKKEIHKIMSSPFTSLNKYRKLPVSKTALTSNDASYDEKYDRFSSIYFYHGVYLVQHRLLKQQG
jgi:hypothetical protein